MKSPCLTVTCLYTEDYLLNTGFCIGEIFVILWARLKIKDITSIYLVSLGSICSDIFVSTHSILFALDKIILANTLGHSNIRLEKRDHLLYSLILAPKMF